jgi:hypothetical protein
MRITAAAPVGDSPAAADVHAAHESAQGVMAAIDEFVGGSNEPWVPGVFCFVLSLYSGTIQALFRLYSCSIQALAAADDELAALSSHGSQVLNRAFVEP